MTKMFPTNLRIAINKNNKDSSISYSRLSGSLGTIFPYFNYDSTKSGWGQSSSQITDLNNYGVKSFEDLPGTNYSALDELNNNWGKWSFIGWSTTLIEYSKSELLTIWANLMLQVVKIIGKDL